MSTYDIKNINNDLEKSGFTIIKNIFSNQEMNRLNQNHYNHHLLL